MAATSFFGGEFFAGDYYAVSAVVRQGDGGIPGWERFKDVKPRKFIPKAVKEVIIDLLVKEVKAPITTLKQELKALEIKYDPAYGDFLKKALKQAIQEAADEEEIVRMFLM